MTWKNKYYELLHIVKNIQLLLDLDRTGKITRHQYHARYKELSDMIDKEALNKPNEDSLES